VAALQEGENINHNQLRHSVWDAVHGKGNLAELRERNIDWDESTQLNELITRSF
jgi:hypothetical protein